jgi:hypothetical protein
MTRAAGYKIDLELANDELNKHAWTDDVNLQNQIRDLKKDNAALKVDLELALDDWDRAGDKKGQHAKNPTS